KYLELDRAFVTELLVSLLGEDKRKDVEKGWKYARELEFTVPREVRWLGRKREDWEEEVISLLAKEGKIERQELLKRIFFNQKWLCDLVMDGLIEKGVVGCEFVRHGRGRPKKMFVFSCAAEMPLRKAVGFEFAQALETKPLNGCMIGLSRRESDFSQLTNSLKERVMGGGWKGDKSVGNYCSYGGVMKMRGLPGSFVERGIYQLLSDKRLSFDLALLSGRVVRGGCVVKFSEEMKKVVVSGEVFPLSDLASLDFKGREAVRFYREVLPELPPSTELQFFEGKTIYVYPYGAPPERWTLLRAYPYQFLLYRAEKVKMPDGSYRKFHHYQLRYKLSLSAYTFFNPYPEELVSEGEPVAPHR
ncbi:MAG: hypothetical protein ABGX17_08245, partial [Desulfurobacteriaceae bacterium]